MNIGDAIVTDSGTYRIGMELGAGGQAQVFVLSDRRTLAKLYYRLSDEVQVAQTARLKRMIARGAPSSAFVWPQEIIRHPSLGYTMEYCDGYLELEKLGYSSMIMQVDLRTRLRICYRIADAFATLHLNEGYAYCDLSEGNILCRLSDGDVKIVDNDNLWVEGVGAPHTVYGTYRCMAPELEEAAARGESPRPTIETDLHSLAVVLFRTLLFHHPLLGDDIHDDFSKEQEALGSKSLYIYHPSDQRNRFTRYQEYGGVPISILPRSTQSLFQDCFVQGLHTPRLRVRETNWKREFTNLLDILVKCPNANCSGKQTFVAGMEDGRRVDQVRCVWCDTAVAGFTILRIVDPSTNRTVRHKVINGGEFLAAHHCKTNRAYDFGGTGVCAEVVSDDTHGLTLRNVSRETFSYCRNGGSDFEAFPPQKRVPLKKGYKIAFGASGYVAEVV